MAGEAFEYPAEIGAVLIAHRFGNFLHTQGSVFQHFHRALHPDFQLEPVWGKAGVVLKQMHKPTEADIAHIGVFF